MSLFTKEETEYMVSVDRAIKSEIPYLLTHNIQLQQKVDSLEKTVQSLMVRINEVSQEQQLMAYKNRNLEMQLRTLSSDHKALHVTVANHVLMQDMTTCLDDSEIPTYEDIVGGQTFDDDGGDTDSFVASSSSSPPVSV